MKKIDDQIVQVKNEVNSVLTLIRAQEITEAIIEHKLQLVIDELCQIRLKTRKLK